MKIIATVMNYGLQNGSDSLATASIRIICHSDHDAQTLIAMLDQGQIILESVSKDKE